MIIHAKRKKAKEAYVAKHHTDILSNTKDIKLEEEALKKDPLEELEAELSALKKEVNFQGYKKEELYLIMKINIVIMTTGGKDVWRVASYTCS